MNQHPPRLQLLSVQRIWNRAKHSGMTDLIWFNQAFFCCFREGVKHAGMKEGVIRILKSEDGEKWSSVARLSKRGFDLRDPHFSIMPDGRLMLTLGGSLYKGNKYQGCLPHVAFSPDGVKWTKVQEIPLQDEWIWRLSWYQGVGYGFSYRLSQPSDVKAPWILTLFKTADGISYTRVKQFRLMNYPSEVTLRFTKEGEAIALLRRRGHAWIGKAEAPYTQWKWKDCGRYVGGPNFIILPNGLMLAGGREFLNGIIRLKTARTAIGFMSKSKYEPVLFLPSRGDNSYPGFVYKNKILYCSYYSSHEGFASIYLAKIKG